MDKPRCDTCRWWEPGGHTVWGCCKNGKFRDRIAAFDPDTARDFGCIFHEERDE